MSEDKKAYPFAVVGFFITDKDIDDVFRKELTPEEIEQLERMITKVFFAKGVDVVIAPSIIPPDQVNNVLSQLAHAVFFPSEEEKKN